jgi:hypothetical protein
MSKLFVFFVFFCLFFTAMTNAAGDCYKKKQGEERFTLPGKDGVNGCAVTLENGGNTIILGSTYRQSSVTHTRLVTLNKKHDRQWLVGAHAEHMIVNYDYNGWITTRIPKTMLRDAIKNNACTACLGGLPKFVQVVLMAWSQKDEQIEFSAHQEYVLDISQ